MYIRKKEHQFLYKCVTIGIMIVVDIALLSKAAMLIYQREVALKLHTEVLEESYQKVIPSQRKEYKRVVVRPGSQ